MHRSTVHHERRRRKREQEQIQARQRTSLRCCAAVVDVCSNILHNYCVQLVVIRAVHSTQDGAPRMRKLTFATVCVVHILSRLGQWSARTKPSKNARVRPLRASCSSKSSRIWTRPSKSAVQPRGGLSHLSYNNSKQPRGAVLDNFHEQSYRWKKRKSSLSCFGLLCHRSLPTSLLFPGLFVYACVLIRLRRSTI